MWILPNFYETWLYTYVQWKKRSKTLKIALYTFKITWTTISNLQKNAFFSILSILSAFYGANFYYYALIFLFVNVCDHINMILYGKDHKVIFGYNILPQKWNKWLISSSLVFFANFGHFGRGLSRATFCDRFQKPS